MDLTGVIGVLGVGNSLAGVSPFDLIDAVLGPETSFELRRGKDNAGKVRYICYVGVGEEPTYWGGSSTGYTPLLAVIRALLDAKISEHLLQEKLNVNT